jgi:DNA ligase (NAD+)
MCDSPVAQVPGEVAYRCTNKKCYAVTLRSLEHFVSKGALDIDGLGPKIIEQLMNVGLVRSMADIYALKKVDLENLERFAEKSADNLIDAINSRRQITLSRFLYALGIRHIGEESARVLAKLVISRLGRHVEELSISELIKVMEKIDLEDLYKIEDFGPVVSQSIYDFFRDDHNLQILKKLEGHRVSLLIEKTKKTAKNSEVYEKTFVLTGSLTSLTREAAKAKIRELGGQIASAVGKKVDYVVAGVDPGSKYQEAQKLGVKIINESEFLKLIK